MSSEKIRLTAIREAQIAIGAIYLLLKCKNCWQAKDLDFSNRRHYCGYWD